MKNLTKIFMAVAVTMFALSCATDATEDLGVKLEGQGVTELTISLEESRTQLGDKVDGLYPVYWSEGDKISVNGVESGEAVIGNDPATATFAVNVVADNLCVAYPAATEGQVLFAEKQNHIVAGNTFENGVATMYGTGVAGSAIQMQHLTGVLKIGIKGEAVLSKVQVSTIDRAPIAGAFNIDFATGELTATTASKDVIEYSFGENGLQLTGDAQYIHVAVPAGEYDELYLTLYEQSNSGNIMYATIKADESKPLAAGKVRTFTSDILYAANAQLFVIDSVSQLQSFKAAVESESGLTMDAILTEDIDMSEVSDWTPINGEKYVNTLIGNGYAIKGLTAPLFATTSASIKGLHLEDVNISTNDAEIMGALVCTLTATDTVVPKVENCSVSGSFTVNNPTYVPAEGVISIKYGGLIGYACGAIIDDCVNHANVKAAQIAQEALAPACHLGGVAGTLSSYTRSDASIVYSEICNSKNYGEVLFDSTVDCTGTIYLGGILACSASGNLTVVISGNENIGDVALASTSATCNIGGICGHAKSDNTGMTENNVNRGKVIVKEGAKVTSTIGAGGLFGLCYSLTIQNSHNYGMVDIQEGSLTGVSRVGGVVGQHTATDSKKNFYMNATTNDGDVLFGATNAENVAKDLLVGGLAGYSQAKINNSENNGDVTICGTRHLYGKRAVATDYKNGTYSVAGLVGYKTEGKITDCANHGKVEIAGEMVEGHASIISQLKVAGITSYVSTDLVGSCVSDGDIVISGTVGCELNVGGMVAFTYGSLIDEVCAANITIKSGAKITGGLIAGGVVSWTGQTLTNLEYKGSIEIEEGAEIGTLCYVGGCVGQHFGIATSAKAVTQIVNNGNITTNGTHTKGAIFGGCVGDVRRASDIDNSVTATLSDITNNSPVMMGSASVTTGENLYVGGCVGNSTSKVTTATNNGKITIDGTHKGGNNYIAGCVANGSGAITGLTNNADIVCPSTANVSSTRMGGLGGWHSAQISGTNLGCITFEGSCTNISMSGICYHGNAVDCINGSETDKTKGVITYTGTSTGNTHFAGITRESVGDITNCKNYGAMNISGVSSGSLYVGGIIYNGIGAGYTCENCENFGDINVSASVGNGTTNTGNDCFVGGLAYAAPAGTEAKTYKNCHNHGTITITSVIANAFRMGGLIANVETVTPINFISCSNTGDLNIAAAPSTYSGGSYYVGGCLGYLTKSVTSLNIEGGLTNSGNISVGGTNAKAHILVGGVIGQTTIPRSQATISGNIVNTGNIEYTGAASQNASVGGIIGTNDASELFSAKFINTGNITATGTFGSGYAATIGGIVGKTGVAISNAHSYCNIKAAGYTQADGTIVPYTGVGMIVGVAYSESVTVSDSSMGGTICRELKEEEDAAENIEIIEVVETIDSSNLYKFIYGSAENIDEAVATANNVTLLTEAPSTEQPAPEDTTTEGTTEGETTTEE